MSIFEHSKSKFAKGLIEERKKSGLTTQQVSDKLGLSSHSSVVNWENDKGFPRLDDFVKLCNLYGVTPNHLLGFNSVMSDEKN